MTVPGAGLPPFASAWLQGQQAFLQFAASPLAAQPPGAGAEQFFAAQYRQLFTLPGMPPAPGAGAGAGAAAGHFGRLLNEIALDAARRLGAALADDAPGATPVTTLRELHALWIECGEAAWSAAAHREEFAAALAELLSALVALRAPAAPP